MGKRIITCAVAMLFAVTASFAAGGAGMTIGSSAFHQGGDIPAKFTCDGGDTSPPLQIIGIPSEAKSLVLIADDPDAPSGLFTHWMVWNIPPKTNRRRTERAKRRARHEQLWETRYGAPCPPTGTHRYFFRVFALDRELDLTPGAKRSQLDAAMRGHASHKAN